MAEPEKLYEALEMLKILGHPVRLGILCNLIDEGELTAGQLVDRQMERASQSQISQYLKVLRDSNIVCARKEGQFIYYKICSPHARTIIQLLHDIYCHRPEEGCSEAGH